MGGEREVKSSKILGAAEKRAQWDYNSVSSVLKSDQHVMTLEAGKGDGTQSDVTHPQLSSTWSGGGGGGGPFGVVFSSDKTSRQGLSSC